MRKILYYLIPCLLLIGVESCKEDEASSPSAPTFSVDKTSGLYNSTEFTFTVDQVAGNAISLLPYGVENPSLGGILIPASSFTNGKATVKFTYGKVGTFNAVAVANNHSTDGTSIKNTYSDAKAITITSDQSAMTAFSFGADASKKFLGSTKTTIDKVALTIAVVVPWGTDLTKLAATFGTSDLASVSVGGTAQESGKTVNSFAGPVTYVVKAQNSTNTTSYVVTLSVTPVEKTIAFKSFDGTEVSKSAKNKLLLSSVDTVANTIVVYDVMGTASADFDSVRVKYALKGKFANAKYGGKKLKQDSLLNLTTSKQITVFPEDSVASGTKTYTLYATTAPKLTLAFNALIPPVSGTTKDFGIGLNVLNGTDLTTLVTTSNVVSPAGVTVTGITADGAVFLTGGIVDYTKDVKFVLSVTDANIGGGVSYKVTYTVKVTVLK